MTLTDLNDLISYFTMPYGMILHMWATSSGSTCSHVIWQW